MASQNFGKYQATELLGSGGMAEVYAGIHPELERKVAIKVILPQFAAESNFEERFRREARVVASLRHPHIVQIYDFDVVEGRHFMVMEYLEGGTLKEHLRGLSQRKATMPLPEVAAFLDAMAGAPDYAHARGTVHRDIKPANILFTAGQEAVLTDFGIAKLMEDSARLTVTGSVVGSPFYMPPEQASGSAVDARSDQYSLGIVLYEMATGRLPFQGASAMAVMSQHLHSAPPAPRSLNAALPIAVEAVLLKVLAKHPEDRFGSAGELAQAFRQAVEGRNLSEILVRPLDENVRTLLSEPSASSGDANKPSAADLPTLVTTDSRTRLLAEDAPTTLAEQVDVASARPVQPLATPAVRGEASPSEPPPAGISDESHARPEPALLPRAEEKRPSDERRLPPVPSNTPPIAATQNFNVGGIQAGIVNQGGEQNFSGNLTFNLDFGEIKAGPPQPAPAKVAPSRSLDDQELDAPLEALRRAFAESPRLERFVRLVTQFHAQLEALPAERANDRKQVVKRVQALLMEMTEAKPDADMVGIMGTSLEHAVQPLAEVDPDLATMVTRITSWVDLMVQPE